MEGSTVELGDEEDWFKGAVSVTADQDEVEEGVRGEEVEDTAELEEEDDDEDDEEEEEEGDDEDEDDEGEEEEEEEEEDEDELPAADE